ncbi:hypothetical protein EJ02DRAFT_47995 [Clathrospora elynae]|uniref:Uncharacterized protein n=1 Tax=Clathrospora elynae TaxID=706981 RepID=A0A6A5SGU4_9PLEO|nr:hypothetical protein EJ02DRAFT_47995 [Clathrospora elynae]
MSLSAAGLSSLKAQTYKMYKTLGLVLNILSSDYSKQEDFPTHSIPMATISSPAYDKIKASAGENFPDALRHLPDPRGYAFKTGPLKVRVKIGTLSGRPDVSIWAKPWLCIGFMTLYNDNDEKLSAGSVVLDAPFAYLWDGIDGECVNQLPPKFDAFVRYCIIEKGYPVDLDTWTMLFAYDFTTTFRQLCEETDWKEHSGHTGDDAPPSTVEGQSIVVQTYRSCVCNDSDEGLEDIRALFTIPASLDQQFDRLAQDFEALQTRFRADSEARQHENHAQRRQMEEAGLWEQKYKDLRARLQDVSESG